MAECRRLREPNEAGPTCSCPDSACALDVSAATVDCPTCHGMSTVDPDPDCPTCHGEGEVASAARSSA